MRREASCVDRAIAVNRQKQRKRCFMAALMISASALWVGQIAAQGTKNSPAANVSSSVQHAISLAERGRCREALPILKGAISRVTDTKLKYRAAIQNAQCAMSLGHIDAALDALAILNHQFPNDPQALYITAHFCSQLAEGAAQGLAQNAPSSYQAQELEAEAFEAHGNWDKAVATYNRILEQYPKLPGIHYRMGRILLQRPATPTTIDDARKEFEAELQIDPSSAAAEFMLGDLARQTQQWDEAVKHYTRAVEHDAGFSEAYLGLGMALNAAGRYSDAIAPLETYTKSVTDDAAGHYQLALAYLRTGRKEDATREMERQRKLNEKVNSDNQGKVP
ncbi:MAG TPA: tetratricopeptide repeat protein [Terriglobales bacterium]|nr:tetratricopeptide repeat protein [Terriglobales bacterium]